MERLQPDQKDRTLQAGMLELVFQASTPGGTVQALPVAQTLVALQQMYTTVASSSEPALGELQFLPIAQKRQLFRLQVVDAWTDSLHLYIGPDYQSAQPMGAWVIGSLRRAFDSATATFIADISRVYDINDSHPIAERTSKALRSVATALRPDGVILKLNVLVVQAEIHWDIARRLEERERARSEQLTAERIREQTSRLIPEPPDSAPAMVDLFPDADREGPYKGKIIAIDPTSRTVTFQCEDYTQPTLCRYRANLSKVVGRLHDGQSVTVYGDPVRSPGERRDKPPVEIIHADFSSH